MKIHATTSRLGLAVAASAALLTFGLAAPVQAAAGGANTADCGIYCANPTSAPSGNGMARTQPAAGTVGKADSKAPPGQVTGGTSNRGYECSLNSGVGRSNPAHTGCATASGDGSGDGSPTGVVTVPGYECYPYCGD